MRGIYTYIPETNHVPREYSVSAILSLLFMVFCRYFLRWYYCTFTLALSEVLLLLLLRKMFVPVDPSIIIYH
jgi:hypothetical protein